MKAPRPADDRDDSGPATSGRDEDRVSYRKGGTYEVPAEGSLGLLALGAAGLSAWRAAREANSDSRGGNGEA